MKIQPFSPQSERKFTDESGILWIWGETGRNRCSLKEGVMPGTGHPPVQASFFDSAAFQIVQLLLKGWVELT